MLSLGRFINHCGRPIQCSPASVLDLALCLRPSQTSALMSTRATDVRRNTLAEVSQGPLQGLLQSSHSTEPKCRPRPRPQFIQLKPALSQSSNLFSKTVEPFPSVGGYLKLPVDQIGLLTKNISESPQTVGHGSFKLPPCFETSLDITIDNPSNSIQLPAVPVTHEKHAARLIVIRRRKMKKHKLRKLRKKMKFDWAKVRQGREMRKEKSFQAELLAQIKEAEKFDAAQYVSEKLRKAHEVPIPRTWKGKRLPEFIIKEKLGIK